MSAVWHGILDTLWWAVRGFAVIVAIAGALIAVAAVGMVVWILWHIWRGL